MLLGTFVPINFSMQIAAIAVDPDHRRPASISEESHRWDVFWGCGLGGGTLDRASHRCTSAKRGIGICGR
jgi:hypothetical protein